MEILVAILWYLHLLMPGASYSIDQINAIAAQNQPAVQSIQTNPDQINKAIDRYNKNISKDNKSIIEEWEDDPQPILQ